MPVLKIFKVQGETIWFFANISLPMAWRQIEVIIKMKGNQNSEKNSLYVFFTYNGLVM